jgi:hypothetical protein
MREGTVDDLAFARAINADVDAHQLSGRAFDVLHDRMERPRKK